MGRALAQRFAAEGMSVVLADVEPGPLNDAVASITSNGASAVGVVADVSREADVQRLAEATIDAFGAVHVLCNNAGVETGGRFEDIPLTAWRWVMDVNFWGVLHGCRTFLPLLRRQGEGHIVNTGSNSSFAAGVPTFGPYTASKFAVLGLTESLDAELRASGEPIGISLLAPGPVRTNMTNAERNRPDDVPATRGRPERDAVLGMLDRITAHSGMDPEQVAALVVEAIRESRFFVLTHPDGATGAIRNRLARMEAGD
jgi:NAD(P)-dependent dehydrogenase (short-subunit alcohol dehydrogenase family)